jgi:hypothetical protein
VSDFEWVAAVVVAVLSVARTIRLIVYDEFPPVSWLRAHILARYAEDSKWSILWMCQFCLSVWVAPGMAAWMWLSGLDTAWWVINGIWAGSYLAAIVVSYDGPEG